MKVTAVTLPFVVAALLMVSGPLFAHHGTSASYDLNKPTELTGTVTEFVWANPHARVFVDVTSADGEVANWGIEMRPPPAGLSRNGWTRRTLQPGDEITITVFPSKFGTLGRGWGTRLSDHQERGANTRNGRTDWACRRNGTRVTRARI